MVGVGEVGGKAIARDAKRRGQEETHAREVHLLHVATCHQIDAQGVVGPAASQFAWKVWPGNLQDVLLAHLSVDNGFQLARRFVGEGVEIHAEVDRQARLGSDQS